jgi:hypothetical protein
MQGIKNFRSFRAAAILSVTAAVGGLALGALLHLDPSEARGGSHRPLRFDIAQDGSTFSFQGPTTAAGLPAAGATFIVQGHVYPEGTLYGGAVSGTNADGSAAFPDEVVGTWSCRGWFLEDCDPGVTGPVLVGQQLWDLDPDAPGTRTIITDGLEPSVNEVDLGVPFVRAITGGTGRFRVAAGEQTSVNFGFNDSLGLDSTHELDVR